MHVAMQDPRFFAIYFLFLWISITFVLSLIGGWFELGRHYRATEPFRDTRWYLRRVSMRMQTSYSGITVGANSVGLYLAVLPFFRIAHPPLLIPWQDISVKPARFLWIQQYEFRFRQVPSARLRVKEKLGRKIQIAAGLAWPGDRTATGAGF
jgi:hypothetical protein